MNAALSIFVKTSINTFVNIFSVTVYHKKLWKYFSSENVRIQEHFFSALFIFQALTFSNTFRLCGASRPPSWNLLLIVLSKTFTPLACWCECQYPRHFCVGLFQCSSCFSLNKEADDGPVDALGPVQFSGCLLEFPS